MNIFYDYFLQLNPVEAGGATIFLELNITIPVVKVSISQDICEIPYIQWAKVLKQDFIDCVTSHCIDVDKMLYAWRRRR